MRTVDREVRGSSLTVLYQRSPASGKRDNLLFTSPLPTNSFFFLLSGRVIFIKIISWLSGHFYNFLVFGMLANVNFFSPASMSHVKLCHMYLQIKWNRIFLTYEYTISYLKSYNKIYKCTKMNDVNRFLKFGDGNISQ